VVLLLWNFIFILVTTGEKKPTPTTTNQQHGEFFLYIWKPTFNIYKMDVFHKIGDILNLDGFNNIGDNFEKN
jgi:hypothetical protein